MVEDVESHKRMHSPDEEKVCNLQNHKYSWGYQGAEVSRQPYKLNFRELNKPFLGKTILPLAQHGMKRWKQ